ncbi:hypothetical protein M9H77_28817 [Catharanthus roseus]|uniref:Uncharacterized protein n=1 Tax=Catharanthus roseus TaxID=4058 RepID=A0ACC0AGS0_CATRO|nr:hypothetical protein M9H77_28817 [Catharanthus roseus]
MNSKEQQDHHYHHQYQTKEEGDHPSDNYNKLSKTSSNPNPSSSSRQWGGGFRNPRIVRVSRTFGGKDRHSKVCTVRGLRDRRIRLSVPTAIQLYDLQDRLGLNQPSKVVDWLLDVTKDDIDQLPPLQMPPSNSNFPHQFFINDIQKDQKWMVGSSSSNHHHHHHQDQEKYQEGIISSSSYQNFFPSNTTTTNQSSPAPSSFPNMLNLPYNPYNNYHQLELPSSNLSLSQFGNQQAADHHQDHHHDHDHNNPMAAMNMPSGSQLYQAALPAALYMPNNNNTVESGAADSSRQMINQFQFLSSNSQQQIQNNYSIMMPTLHLISSPLKSLTLNFNPNKILQERDDDDQDKGGS